MSDPTQTTITMPAGDLLAEWLPRQRWYGSKSHALSGIEPLDQVTVGKDLLLTLLQAKLATGSHQTYQLPLAIRGDGEVVLDPLSEPEYARELLDTLASGGEFETAQGWFGFRHLGDGFELAADAPVRSMGVEQSNTSVVFGDALVLKLFRRLEAGINPELEVLRFLTAHGYPHIAPLYAWYEYDSPQLAATLGIVQKFVPAGVDGWTTALEEIPSDPERFLSRAAALGVATATLHNTLASDPGDPAFSPEEPSNESLALLTATIDEDIEQRFLALPSDPRLDPIRDRAADVRERLAARPQLSSAGGSHIRIHGDYHLGQALAVADDDWLLLDFEGEPARPLPERRMKRSALRDVASMLRSFAYAVSAVSLQRGLTAPEGYERRVRDAYLDAYLNTVEKSLLPGSESAIGNLLAIFELEKAMYELQYELDNRPDWVEIPVAGIVHLLEQE